MAGVSSETSGRTYGGESQEHRSARRRRQLLDAGLDLFGSIGYRATTVRVLCRQARVADRYFYESFTNTEDLLLAVYQECVDRLLTAVATAVTDLPDDLPLAEVAHAALDALFATAEDERLARVVWLEVLGVGPRVDVTYQRAMRTFGDLVVAQLLTRRPGDAPTAPARRTEQAVVATAVVGGISQVATDWLLSGYDVPRSDLVAAATRFLAGVASVLDPS